MNTTEAEMAQTFEALPEERRAELTQWLCEKRVSRAAAIKRCRQRWNVIVTAEQMKAFHEEVKGLRNQQKNLKRLKTGAAAARVFQKLITDYPVEMFDILFRTSGQSAFEMALEGKGKEAIRVIHEHLRLELLRRKDDRDEKRFGLMREKWEFDASAACLKRLPELKAISNKPELSFKEKLRQIRLKLFGSAP